MRKSTDYGIGGAAFLSAGAGILVGVLFTGFGGSEGPLFVAGWGSIATLLVVIGAYWITKAQGFAAEESKRESPHDGA